MLKEEASQKEALFVFDTTVCPVDTNSMSFDTERQDGDR